MLFRLRHSAFLLAVLWMNSLPGAASAHSAESAKVDLPPSVTLDYSVKAEQSGFSIDGNTQIQWHEANGKFSILTETQAMLFGKIMSDKTEGFVDSKGLEPLVSSQKRLRKDRTTATFDRDKKILSFDSSDKTYPIQGGEQDRNSAIWQLIGIARGAPKKFKPGSEWTMFVAGPHDADPWTFKVLDSGKTRTPLGEMKTIHLVKRPQEGDNDQVEIWLAPSLEWYPVRLRYTESDGDTLEQMLTSVDGKEPAASSSGSSSD